MLSGNSTALPPEPTPAFDPLLEPKLLRLRDGSSVTVRAIQAADEEALRDFLRGLCAESRRLRFFGSAVDTDGAAGGPRR